MKTMYANIYKREANDECGNPLPDALLMCFLNSVPACEEFEAGRPKRDYNSGGAKLVARIRVDVNTLCVEGRFDD